MMLPFIPDLEQESSALRSSDCSVGQAMGIQKRRSRVPALKELSLWERPTQAVFASMISLCKEDGYLMGFVKFNGVNVKI